MQSIRTRLAHNHLLVLVTGMTLAAALSWGAVSSLYIESQRDNLLAQARLIAASLDDSPLPQNPGPYSQAANIAPGIHTRLLTEGGAVVVGLPPAEAFVQAPPAEGNASVPTSELLQRPEIRSALSGTPATAIRRPIGTQRVLYAAAPILANEGSISGLVYIATPLPGAGLPPKILLQFAGALLLAVVLASLAGRYLAHRMARPLEGLSQAASAIADGDLQARAPVETDIAELHGLGQTFNSMAQNLQHADETRKAFIADVTHELRTPLTVIKGTIETLEDGALDDTAGRGPLMASMGRETDRLIRMVNELLVLARADSGQLSLDMQPLDLADLARGRCENMNLLASRSGVELKVEIPAGENTRVLADVDRLAQVLDNLLDNAIRHSSNGTTVRLSIRQAVNEIECSVIDRGSGIPTEHLPHIFERFYRVDRSRDRNRGGTGLGLAIARALILAQGGHISAHSAKGRGTTVTFCLPTANNMTHS